MFKSVSARVLLATSLALGVSLGAVTVGTTVAHAAAAPYIATPNGMVGIEQEILVFAPKFKGQPVILGVNNAASSATLQTTIGTNGFGSASWTPNASGPWTLSGLGSALSIGSATISVAAAPTSTVLLSGNFVQSFVNNQLVAVVSAQGSSIPPQGTVTVVNENGAVKATGGLTPLAGTGTATANLTWIPDANGTYPLVATFTPSNNAFGASTAPTATPQSGTSVVPVALALPPVMYLGESAVVGAVLGTDYPNGSVAFLLNGAGISGSIFTTNSSASTAFTPWFSGNATITVSYTSIQPNGRTYTGTSFQPIAISNPRSTDAISVQGGNGKWSVGAPIVLTQNKAISISGGSQSGSPVVFSEEGPCTISGSTLTGLAAGECTVTATSPGNSVLKPVSQEFTVTVQAAKKKR